MGARISKFKRRPEALAHRKITDRSLEIIRAIARYRFVPSSLLVRLVDGNARVTQRHLQHLFHKGFINRFAFPKNRTLGEFNYYLDNLQSLQLLTKNGSIPNEIIDRDDVRRNQDGAYCEINDLHKSAEAISRMFFLHHEVMISRFHFMLEMACKKSEGKLELARWRQGSSIHNTVTDPNTGEILPHRPDAFFTLRFPHEPEGQNRANFFYEADRKTTNATRFAKKLQAHREFIRQKKHERCFGIHRIRAVLIETLDTHWAESLRQTAAPFCEIPLFWFTASEIFTRKCQTDTGSELSFVGRPEIIFRKVWVSTLNDELLSLLG